MENIKNIIFDFGGVIINLDMETPLQLLSLHTKLNVNNVWKELRKAQVFDLYETGILDDEEFRNSIRNFSNNDIDNELIDQIWNSMLLNIPPERIEILKKVRNHYKSFLLSNSNSIHYKYYLNQLNLRYGYSNFDELFDKAYFSFNIKKLKPAADIFQHVLIEQSIKAEETLFIDDSLVNIEAAKKIGLQVIHISENLNINDLFDENGVLRIFKI